MGLGLGVRVGVRVRAHACSILSMRQMKVVGSRMPPKVPPTASISMALSTSDSAVSPKQCSFQYAWL